MKKGSFIIQNTYSEEINSLIQERPVIPAPRRKVELRDMPGRSGAIAFDEESYENTDISLSLFVAGGSDAEVRGLKERITHLFSAGTYVDFTLYTDSQRVYKVIPSDLIFNGDGRHRLILPYTVNLSVKPFKHLRNGPILRDITESIALNNPSPYEARPLITIYGNGDFRLIVNDEEFAFRDVDSYITIDSEFMNAYKDTENRNHRMYSVDFPILHPGKNVISWTDNVTKIDIEPRWCWLI